MSTNWIRVFVRISNFLRSLFRSSCETKKPSTNWFAPPVPVACSMQCNIWTLNREDYCQRCYKRNSKSNIFLIDYTIHLFIPFILKEKAEQGCALAAPGRLRRLTFGLGRLKKKSGRPSGRIDFGLCENPKRNQQTYRNGTERNETKRNSIVLPGSR